MKFFNTMKKDINKYWDKYKEIYSFEEIMREYRDKKALEFINEKKPKNILEIGCGFSPLFTRYKNYDSYTVVEPGLKAYKNAITLSKGDKKVYCINNFLEESFDNLSNQSFDFIICSGVLHETNNAKIFLKKIALLMKKNTYLYICVPNANSLHKIIAKNMGIIKSVFDKSNRFISLKQNTIFDKKKLLALVKETIPESTIIDSSSFFLKPFTHEQMMICLDKEVINKDVTEGLYKSTEFLPDIGSELYCFLKKNPEYL